MSDQTNSGSRSEQDSTSDGAAAISPGTFPSRRARREQAAETASDIDLPDDDTPSEDPDQEPEEEPKQSVLRIISELAIIVVVATVISILLRTFLFQAFYIPSESMEDTLLRNDRVIVTKLAPGFLDVNRGDIVVFTDPGGWLNGAPESEKSLLQQVGTWVGLIPEDAGSHLIKRVIGVGGDEVICCSDNGLITVNGVEITEEYVKDGSLPSHVEFTANVPDGYIWVLGDSRQNSLDSRFHPGKPGGGAVSLDEVVGIAQLRFWPLDRAAVLSNPGSVFSEVSDAG